MSNLDKKTTSMSDDPSRPLEVEWDIHHPHIRMPNETFQAVERYKVTIVHPGYRVLATDLGGIPEWQRVHLVDLSPQTALNLLDWLSKERPILEYHAALEAGKVLFEITAERESIPVPREQEMHRLLFDVSMLLNSEEDLSREEFEQRRDRWLRDVQLLFKEESEEK